MTPVVPYAAAGSTISSTSTSAASSTGAAGDADKNMFLQLLVSQLQNQDPLNPMDGTQFVGELAEFQQLEESVNMGQDISAIRQDLNQLVSSPGSGNSQS